MYNDLKMETLFILEWPKLFTEDWQLDRTGVFLGLKP